MTNYAEKFNLPIKTHIEIKNYFTQKSRLNVIDENWDRLFVDLPSSLRSDVVQATHGKIIKGIIFFKDKPQDFLINIIPRL